MTQLSRLLMGRGLLVCVMLISLPAASQAAQKRAAQAPAADGDGEKQPGTRQEMRKTNPPTVANVKYGPHAENVLDFWQAKSDKPTPLLLNIHGGGFRHGDKGNINPEILDLCLKSGVSVASIEYRLSGVAIYPAQMLDCARAVQFLRHQAGEWKLDPKRVASTGGSAGAGISLWLAFHDDLADPKNGDPVLRESTRLTCALVFNMQCTYDPREIRKIVPGDAYNVAPLKQLHGLSESFNWDKDPIDASLDARLKDCSPLTHLTKDDVPVFARNSSNNAKPGNIHHPNFATYLKEQMDKTGVECVIHLDTDYKGGATEMSADMFNWMKKHFATE